MTSVAQQIYEYGVRALNQGNFDLAIEYFLSVLEKQEENWTCRWQLVLAYQKANNVNAARHQVIFLSERCPDETLRGFAQLLLKSMCLQEKETEPAAAPQWLEILRNQVQNQRTV